MEYRVAKEIAKRHKAFHFVYSAPGQFDHRGMVIRATCELEDELVGLLLAFFKVQNAALSEGRARKDLFSENGLLGSITKMTKIAHYLGLVSDEEAHDLRIISRLRNQYAHGLRRGQFCHDEESAALVRKLKLFQNSTEVFAGFDEQGIFLACQDVLVSRLRTQAESLKSGRIGS